jgi:hypothetical protein
MMSNRYKISIDRKSFDDFLAKAKIDPRRPAALNLVGRWSSLFEAGISNKEGINVRLSCSMSRVYPKGTKRATANYFNGNCLCSLCSIKYKIKIETEPAKDAALIEVVIERDGEHDTEKHDPKRVIKSFLN